MKKLFGRLISICFLASSLLSGAVLADCALSVGWEPWQPYQLKVGDKVTGLDNDLFSAIAAQAGCVVTFKERPWKRILEEVKLGELDVALGASKTEERAVVANFSDPYREETMVMYVRKGDAAKMGYHSFTEMTGKPIKIGVIKDYFYGDEFAKAKDSAQFQSQLSEVVNDEQNLKKLIASRLDAILIDKFVGADLVKQNGWGSKVEVHPLAVASDSVYLLLSKETVTPEIMKKLNDALAEIKQNGKYQEIVDSYLK